MNIILFVSSFLHYFYVFLHAQTISLVVNPSCRITVVRIIEGVTMVRIIEGVTTEYCLLVI